MSSINTVINNITFINFFSFIDTVCSDFYSEMPPQLPTKAKQYTQKYRPEWKADKKFEAWLGPVAGNENQARCSFCNSSFVAKFQNVKKHYESEMHKRHERDRGLAGRSANIIETFAAAGASAAQVRRQKETDLQLATFLVKHSTFEAASHLAPLVGNNGTYKPKLGKTKAAALIKNVIGPANKEDLAAVRGKPFSLVIDEATDISVNKTLGLVIRYPDLESGKIIDSFYRLITIRRGDADSLYAAIRDALEEDNLDINLLVGLGVDGASAMVGRNHSVATLLKAVVPHLIVVRCVAHSLALVGFDAYIH